MTGGWGGAARRALLLAALGLVTPAPAPAEATAPQPPPIAARAWILLDAGDRARLAASSPDQSLAMASTTKLMTAYVALRELPLHRRVVAPPYHPIAGESLLGLEPGERISVYDLLYGLLLPSGNDAAVALADGVAGSTSAFVTQMNRAARRLDLRQTSYANPIGLDQPGNYSSPHDLATLALELRRRALFRRIVDTPRATLHTGTRRRTVVNRNDLVREVPWVDGVKTGYTPAAGYVLVGSGTRKGVTLISVVMGANTIATRDADTLALLRYGFSLYRVERAIRPGETLARATVADGERAVALVARDALRATVRRGQRPRISVDAPGSVAAPVHRGQRIGRATVTVGGEPVGRVPLVAGYSVRAADTDSLTARADDLLPGPRAVVWAFGLVVVSAVGVGALAARRRRG